MTAKQHTELERAIEIAKEKQHKVTIAKAHTGETVYAVRSSSAANHYYLLHIEAGRIRCQCEAHKQGHICSHAAAVRLLLVEQRAALESIEAAEAPAIQHPCVICGAEGCMQYSWLWYCDEHTDDDLPDEIHDALLEAERLEDLPRELVGATLSEADKLEDAAEAYQPEGDPEQYAEQQRDLLAEMDAEPVHKCHDCGQPEQAYRCHSCQIKYECEKQFRDEMRAERERIAAKRERACLATDNRAFSIFATE